MRLGARAALAAMVLLAAAAAAGCVSDTRPSDAACRAPTIALEVTLAADSLRGDQLSVCRDQEVSIEVSPQVDGVFHIHGYDEQLPATTVVSGVDVTLTFVADRSGQFPVEFHALDDPQGVEIGIFTVHEP